VSARQAWLVLAVILLLVSAADARPWAWLGVRIREMTEPEMDEVSGRHGLGEGFGVVIVDVMEDTPAARAGMKQGDIVVAFEGRPVTDTRVLQRLIARAPVDGDIRLTVLRREGRRALSVRLATMPRPVAGERVAAEFGFVVREPGAAPPPPGGPPPTDATLVIPAVSFVVRGSVADKAGLAVGDVILLVNEQAVLTRDAVRETLGDLRLDQPLRLTVRREGERVSLTLAAPEERAKP
jgi:S1-C subfamily serine protease